MSISSASAKQVRVWWSKRAVTMTAKLQRMLVLVDHPADGVARVTLNRPEKRNALSLELREQLAGVLEEQTQDESVRCVVLTGAGTAFCAGMDTTQFGGDRANKERIVATSTRLFELVARYPLPLVAAVNGPAVAGGFALALLCDVRIAAPAATFGFPEIGRFIPPSYGAALAALPEPLARRLCLTGELLDARRALELGLVDAVGERPRSGAAQIGAPPVPDPPQVKRPVLPV